MAKAVRDFETSSRGFTLAPEQRAICNWFGEAMDIAYEEDQKGVPVPQRTQKVCLLIGAGGTGKTTIVLTLLLEVFVLFFPSSGR